MSKHPTAILRRPLLAAAALASFSPLAHAEPAWQALPAETVAAFRMPATQQFVQSFREQTVAGQRIFTADRWNQIVQLVQQYNSDDWEQFTSSLEEYGFTTDDLLEIAQSNWGVGFVATPRGADQLPRMMILGWADLDDQRIDQIYAAVDKSHADNPQPEERMRRIDLDLAGAEVRQYSIAEMGMDRQTDWSMPDDAGNMTQEQLDEHWAKLEEENNKAQYTKVDETHLLVTRQPGRLILALGLPQSKEEVRQQLADGQNIDWDSATDAQSVQDCLTRFLLAQGEGEADSFAARLSAKPAADQVLGQDNALFEFAADMPRVFELIGDGIRLEQDEETAAQFEAIMRSLGLDGLGVAAASGYFSDQAIRYQLFAEAAAPRRGLPGTLDAATLPAEPPAWVPADVTYFHLAYDLSQLYDVVLQTVQDIAGPEAAQQVQMGNMMVQNYAQADIPTILRALGTRHSVMLMEGREFTTTAQEWDFEAETMKTVERQSYMRPGAMVWDLADGEVWNRVMMTLKNFAGMAGGAEGGVATVDEQGFTGLRSDAGTFPGSLMLGQQKLMFGFGPDVSAQALSLLNNPPADGQSMATSPMFAEGAQLLDYRDNVLFFIQDGGEDAINSKRQMTTLFESPDADMDPELWQQIQQIIPSDDDLRASFGVSVGQVYLTDEGLIYEGAAATPAAE